jgi:hypothetical protein
MAMASTAPDNRVTPGVSAISQHRSRRNHRQRQAINQDCGHRPRVSDGTIVPAWASGFQWLPWNLGPHLTPWAAIGLPIRNRNLTALGDHQYGESSLSIVAAVHVGWELEIL